MIILKRIYEYLNTFLSSKNKKKVVENAVIVIIIGIILVIAGGSFFEKGNDKKQEVDESAKKVIEASAKAGISDEKAENYKKIEEVLSQINGAGKVSVLITYVSGKEIVPAVDLKKTDNETNEKDNGGGTRNINQSDLDSKIAYEENQGGVKKPIILKEFEPAVKGVVVVADGANDPSVRENLSRAVQVLVDVPIHKIQVFERENLSK